MCGLPGSLTALFSGSPLPLPPLPEHPPGPPFRLWRPLSFYLRRVVAWHGGGRALLEVRF